MATKIEKHLSVALGRPLSVKGIKIPKIQKQYKLNKNKDAENDKDFIADEIDYQKSINSANVTTLDYLLSQDTEGAVTKVKDTLSRLASLNKNTLNNGKLLDANGNKIITRDEVQTNIVTLKQRELLLLQENEKIANAIKLKNTTVIPTDTVDTQKETN